MDSQGAGFAFDTTMDFSTVFTAPQQALNKPEDNTPGLFFADEGIDTTTGFSFDTMNPAILSTPQMSFDMQQPLTMDNTSGSASDWNQHLTPHMHNAFTAFPPTPTQSFDGSYTQPITLGKRSLQLDIQDFPQAKRQHEATDFTLFPMDTTSSWTLDAQPTTPSSIELGLPDEAADVCAMWFNKYNVLPSDRHIDSLSQLTGETADAIRSWFGRLLKQGMGGSQGDSAYKSQTGLIQQQDSFWNDAYSSDTLQTSPTQLLLQPPGVLTTPEATCSHQSTTAIQPATSLRGGKKRCTPTDDRQLLDRDPNKIYQCTRKCGKRYGRKCDWKRNEEEGYPCKSWVCSLCQGDGVENVKPCFRKYHFVQHFRNIHPDLNADEYEEVSVVSSDTEFPRQCGFCRHRFTSRQDRIDHIADHFKQGKCMLDWNDGDVNDSDDTDNNDNDDDDQPDSDGDKPSNQPPQSDPRGGEGSDYNGGSDSGSGSGDQPSQGGYFQFQLSQLEERDSERQFSIVDQPIVSIGNDLQQPPPDTLAGEQYSLHGQHVAPAGDDKVIMARDDVSRMILSQIQYDLPVIENNQHGNVVEPGVAKNSSISSEQSSMIGSVQLSTTLSPEDNGGKWPDLELQRSRSSARGAAVLGSQESHDLHCSALKAQCLSTASPVTSMTIPQTGFATEVSMTDAPDTRALQSLTKIHRSDGILQSVPTASQSFLSIKLLGAGGFSTVDEVVHRDTNLRIGRKTLKNRDETAAEELKKEVKVLQKLRHPHVIRFLGAYSKGDKMSILLSPVAETTLAIWLERSAIQKSANLADTVVKMFGCLVSSVRYLHEQRPVVRHMDIKPQNILIVESGQEFPHVVLSDFGVSSSDEPSDGQPIPITRRYVAPEVFGGFARKQAADIWSLGCVFAEMASVPFGQGNTGWLTLRKKFSGRRGKNYWQDIQGVQDGLSNCLDQAATVTEESVVHTLKAMLSGEPAERPTAVSLTLVFTPAPCCLSWPNDNVTFPGPHEELDEVEKLVPKDSSYCSAPRFVPDEKGQLPTMELSSARSWLQDCLHTHEACRHYEPNDSKIPPTRLIDVCPDGQPGSFVRIVDSALIGSDPALVEYIALSYVWGPSPARLTTQNLTTMQTALPLQDLPESIVQAITIVRNLGHQYVWVDSLCVLQDSQDDKEHECANMASTFRNATLTVVLGQLTNDTLQRDMEKLSSTDTSRDVPPTFANRLRTAERSPLKDFNAFGFSWDTRAWVLQERLLSRRFLHVGKQMYWECNSLKASETFPRGLTPLVWEKVHSKNTDVIQVAVKSHRPRKPTTTAEIHEDLQASLHQLRETDTINHSPSTKHGYQASLSPCRLRDCQWIKHEGDGIGDSMEAAQTSLQLGNAKASPSSTSCSCLHSTSPRNHHKGNRVRRIQAHQGNTVSGQGTGTQDTPTHHQLALKLTTISRSGLLGRTLDGTPEPSTSTSASSSSSIAMCSKFGREGMCSRLSRKKMCSKLGKKKECTSGQLDQHGATRSAKDAPDGARRRDGDVITGAAD